MSQSRKAYGSAVLSLVLAVFLLNVPLAQAGEAQPAKQAGAVLQERVVPGFHFFYSKQEMSFADLQQKSEQIAQQLALTIAKDTQTEYYGAFTYLMDYSDSMDGLAQASAQRVTTRMGWPVRDAVVASGGYQTESFGDFKCVTREFSGDQQKLHQTWLDLVEAAVQQGYKPTGEGRTLIKLHSRGYVVAELQLGVR